MVFIADWIFVLNVFSIGQSLIELFYYHTSYHQMA